MRFVCCAYCGKRQERSLTRPLPYNLKQAIIVLAGLVTFCAGNLDVLHGLYVISEQRTRKHLCHCHYAEVAATLTREITNRGVALRNEGLGRRCSSGYFLAEEIPDQIMNQLFISERRVTETNCSLSKRDLSIFLYDALDRYLKNDSWMYVSNDSPTESETVSQSQEIDADLFKRPKIEQGPISESENVSMYSPQFDTSGSTYDMLEEDELLETDITLLKKYFLVEGEQLLQLFKFCPQCGCDLPKRNGVRLTAVGTAPVVHYLCRDCSIRGVSYPIWEGQKRVVAHPRERLFKGNVIAAVSAITTGLRFNVIKELHRWAEQAKVAMFSKTTFWKVFDWTKAAIKAVYSRHKAMISDKVRSLNEGDVLDLAADGAYDSRGYSALIGKVVLADLKSKLVLDMEVMHRSETEEISSRMEIEGTRRLLRRTVDKGFRVRSLTTDRSYSLSALIGELQEELGPIVHYFDGWHLVKWLGNELHKVSKRKNCEVLNLWTEKVKTHLWKSIELGAGNGDMTRHLFNSTLNHIKGLHSWTVSEETGSYVGCMHQPLEGTRQFELSEGSLAFKKFREVVLSKRFQKDLKKASPHGGTSICECKNALDRLYCRKEIFYPISTYPLYAMMSTMHLNTLRLTELSGERTIGHSLADKQATDIARSP